ncbi:MAG TPA: argininosuccinate synthase, partial [Methanoregulaceae archaeon]|nr:argininosuccinate synthase [Methanoregulaceae archaeon]
MNDFIRTLVVTTFVVLLGMVLVTPVLGATTQVHVVKYASDKTTILAEQTLTYQEMEATLPVMGDGITHYYLQGPC